jgi:predicted outer membrane protein
MTTKTLMSALALAALVAAPAMALADCADHATAADTSAADTSAASASPGRFSNGVGPHGDVFVDGQAIEATVTSIDREQGLVTIETGERSVTILAPPEQLAGVQEGDVIHIVLDED